MTHVPRFLMVVLASIGLVLPILLFVPPGASAADPSPCSLISAGGASYEIRNITATSYFGVPGCFGTIDKPGEYSGIGHVEIKKHPTAQGAQEAGRFLQRNETPDLVTGIGEWAGERRVVSTFRYYRIAFYRGVYEVRIWDMDDIELDGQATSLGRTIAQDIDRRLGAPGQATPAPAPTATAVPSTDATRCFNNGVARITIAEIEKLANLDIAEGKSYDDIIADVEMANAARGGSGTFTCRIKMPEPANQPSGTDAKDPSACFAGGAARVTWQEMVEVAAWGQQRGRPSEDIKADIESLNRSRGGRGTLTCDVGSLMPATGGSPSRADCQSLIDREQSAKDEIKAQMAELEQEMYYWRQLELMPEYRWMAYITESVAPSWFDPIPPNKMARVIDRKYGRPRYGDAFVRREGTNEWVDPGVLWLESDAAKQADAEKSSYELEYAQRMERIQQARALPQGPEDIRQFYEPSRQLDEIATLQDFYLDDYRAHDAKYDEYVNKRDDGASCQ